MILWGLDLNQIRPSAFTARRMWAPRFHLRRTRFVVYQLAMILLVVGESVGTAAMSKYLDLQSYIEKAVPGVSLYQNDVRLSLSVISSACASALTNTFQIVGVASFTIFAGVYTATVLGTMFFFNLFWPALPETKFWARTKLYSATFATLAVLGACISSTIIGAARAAHYEFAAGVDHAAAVQAIRDAGLTFPPLRYKKYSYVIVWLVFIWVGWLFTVWRSVSRACVRPCAPRADSALQQRARVPGVPVPPREPGRGPPVPRVRGGAQDRQRHEHPPPPADHARVADRPPRRRRARLPRTSPALARRRTRR